MMYGIYLTQSANTLFLITTYVITGTIVVRSRHRSGFNSRLTNKQEDTFWDQGGEEKGEGGLTRPRKREQKQKKSRKRKRLTKENREMKQIP